MIILIFALLLISLFLFDFYFSKKVKDWVENYNSHSQYHELKVDRKRCTVKTRDLYGKTKTLPKGFISSYLYRNSILFYNKQYDKYFSIESYREEKDRVFRKKSAPLSEVFSLDLAGEKISAWINTDDLNADGLGTEKNPVRIFKLKYDSDEYLADEYTASVKRYRTDSRLEKTEPLLMLIGILLALVCAAVGAPLFFGLVTYLLALWV